MADVRPAKTLTIDDRTLVRLMSDPQVTRLLPCLTAARKALESVATGGTNCNRCERRKNAIKASARLAAKRCIAELRDQKLAALKGLLRVDRLSVPVTTAGGKRAMKTL